MMQDKTSVNDSYFLLRLRLVSRITLVVSVLFCAGILLTLAFATGNPGAAYDSAIRSLSQSLLRLGPALLAATLLLALLSSAVIRMISHRATLKVAGPLYRFARNIETFIESGPVTPVPTRQEDQLKPEKQQIERSIVKLQAHYDAIRAATETALVQIDSQKSPAAAIAQLKGLDRATRL